MVLFCFWDAWNRLVKVTDSSDANIALFEYDGINRRIVRKEYSGGVLSRTRHFYHSEMDQVLEERVDAATAADRQYVWGERYIDELIVRDRNADASGATGNYGVSGSGLEQRLYATNDALYSVTALTNASGTVQERFQYDPYGQAKVLDANFADDGNGVSDVDWEYRFTGRILDVDTGLDYYRARYYHPTLGRFLSRDPFGYESRDANRYRYVRSNPPNLVNPLGAICCSFPIEEAVGLACSFACSWWETAAAAHEAARIGDDEANNIYVQDTPEQRALRHCIASAYLASVVGYICADCLGTQRELY